MKITVALKWSATRIEVDALSGSSRVTPGRFGIDPGGLAALAWARHLAEDIDATVTAVTVGPVETEAGLRDALALGAEHAVRVDAPAGCAALDVAAALATVAGDADLVITGARSIDRGSAAVAPALATILERPSACGLLAVEWDEKRLLAQRRLPAGRREHLRLAIPAVISMEAGTIPLARAELPALLEAAGAELEIVCPDRPLVPEPAGTTTPYRPRPRTVPERPAGDEPRERIASLSGALEMGSQAQQLELPPEAAAAEILATLRRWGYLDQD